MNKITLFGFGFYAAGMAIGVGIGTGSITIFSCIIIGAVMGALIAFIADGWNNYD